MTRSRLFAAAIFAFARAAVSATPPSHCASEEDTLFTCSMGNKVLSFCAAKGSSNAAPAWIQYRFGRIGAPELVYPSARTSPVNHFRYTTEKGGRWIVAVVEFSIDGHSYVLNASGNSNIPESEASLLVVRPDGSRKVLQCADPGVYAAAGLYPFERFRLPEVREKFKR